MQSLKSELEVKCKHWDEKKFSRKSGSIKKKSRKIKTGGKTTNWEW